MIHSLLFRGDHTHVALELTLLLTVYHEAILQGSTLC